MADWAKINCRECGKCNKKGLPSVMKGSKICEERRGLLTPERKTAWTNFMVKIQTFFSGNGFMRRSGAPKRKEEEDDDNKEEN